MLNPRRTFSEPLALACIYGCFFLSGCAALLYQVAWMRQFSAVFGTSEYAVATVLSAYMGGLALGAALSGQLARLISRPVLFYGFLEGAIALSALMVPSLIAVCSGLYVSFIGSQPDIPDAAGLAQPVFYLLMAFVVLLLPTACMGATLPVLTRYAVQREGHLSRRIGMLYSINTAGAVIGVLVAGFALMPQLGLRGTVYAGVGINLLVFLLAVLVHRVSQGMPTAAESQGMPAGGTGEGTGDTHGSTPGDIHRVSGDARGPAEEAPWRTPAQAFPMERMSYAATLILPLMTLSGMVSFAYEVLWTRLLSHILGGSVAAFSIMLASFLTGIALGSNLAGRFISTRYHALIAFIVCQAGIAGGSMLIYAGLNRLPLAELSYQASIYLAYLGLLPATLFIGATFPIAVRIYAESPQAASIASSRIYACNTVGAILGATLAVLALMPLLKYEGAIRLLVIINMAIAACFGILVLRSNWTFAGVCLGVVTVCLAYWPERPEQALRYSPIASPTEGDLAFYGVGRSGTVALYQEQGVWRLRNNGLPEADVLPLGAPSALDSQRLLGALPIMARPDAESVLVVGLGAGKTVTGIAPTVRDIDVIELEPAVIEANLAVSEQRKYRPLADPRVSLAINDARSALALTAKKYDVIVSQPSHPWTAGASHLYTREFMQLVADSLGEDGIFLQWIGAQFVDEALLRSLCATVVSVFPHARIYQWAPQVLSILASPEPIRPEAQIIATGRPFADAPLFYQELGASVVEDLLAALMMDDAGVHAFAAGARPITDDFNLMAMRSERLHRAGEALFSDRLDEMLRPFMPALDPGHEVHRELGSQIWFPRLLEKYAQLELHRYYLYQELLLEALSRAGNPQSLLVAGLLMREQGEQERAQELLGQFSPMSNEAAFIFIQPWLGTLAAGQADAAELPQEVADAAAGLTGPGRAVVEALNAMALRDFQQIADLDLELSLARPSDPWYAEAVKLRVDWRNLVSNPELQSDLAEQAVGILDLAMANSRDAEFHVLRVASALRAGSANVLIESIRGAYMRDLEAALGLVEGQALSIEAAGLDSYSQQVGALLPRLIEFQESGAAQGSDLAELIAQLMELRQRLDDALVLPPPTTAQ